MSATVKNKPAMNIDDQIKLLDSDINYNME